MHCSVFCSTLLRLVNGCVAVMAAGKLKLGMVVAFSLAHLETIADVGDADIA